MSYLSVDDETAEVREEDGPAQIILTPERVVHTREQQLTRQEGRGGEGERYVDDSVTFIAGVVIQWNHSIRTPLN